MALQFRPEPGLLVSGLVRYVLDDHAFDFEPGQPLAVEWEDRGASILLGTLQVEVAVEARCCLYAWGYCPTEGWDLSSLSPPDASSGRLLINEGIRLTHGVGVEAKPGEWLRYFDPLSGWFSAKSAVEESSEEAIEFATDTRALLRGGQLAELWLRPYNWKEVARSLTR